MPIVTPAPKAPAPKGVAALVNGRKIYRFQVANEALKTVGPQILNQMILIELVSQEAAKQGIIVTTADVAAKLADVRKQYDQRGMGLDAFLAQRHQSIASYKDYLTTELKVEALVAKTMPPAAPVTRYHVRHLLVLTSPTTPAMAPGAKPAHTEGEALAIIAKAQAELKAGKSFPDVANEYTEDPSNKDPITHASKGGDLGLVDAKTNFVPTFLQAMLKLKPGETTAEPVKSEYGYHLISMDSSSIAPLPADKQLYAASAAVDRTQQVQQAIPGYVQKLRAGAKVVDYLSDGTPAAPPQMRMPMRRFPQGAMPIQPTP